MAQRSLLASIAVITIACGGEERAQINAPRLGTPFLLIGAAGGGRPLAPRDLRVVKSTEIESLEVPGEGDVTVEMLYAGLRPEDLPDGLTPDRLEFVSRRSPATRSLPPLVLPHLLAAPTKPGAEGTLVPIEEEGLSEEARLAYRERFEALTAEVGVHDPCDAPEIEFKTPRIPAVGVETARVMSSGEIYLGFSATSTAIIGRITSGIEVELIGVGTGSTAIRSGESSGVLTLGDGETTGPDGAPAPSELAMLRGGVLPHVARYQSGRWIDETPRDLDPGPSRIRWLARAEIDGEAKLCMAGSVSGSGAIGSGARLGGVWCRAEAGGDWSNLASIEGARNITAIIARPGMPLLAIDYGGTVYRRTLGGDWIGVLVPAVNQDCGAIACARLDVVAIPSEPSSDLVAVVAGIDGHVYAIRGTDPNALVAGEVEGVTRALFADERAAVAFQSAVFAPDGSLWLGSDATYLVRVSPDLRTGSRVCLSAITGQQPVTALAAAPDGRLLIATSPPSLGLGTWRVP
jgi:hypothetical protein